MSGLIRLEFLPVLLYVFICYLKREDIVIPNLELIISVFAVSLVALITTVHLSFDVGLIFVSIKMFAMFWGAYVIYKYGKINKKNILVALRITTLFSLMFFALCVATESFQGVALALKGETYGLEDKLEFYRLWFPTSAHTFHLGLFFFTCLCTQILIKEKLAWLMITFACGAIAARSSMIASALVLIIGMWTYSRGKFLLFFCSATVIFTAMLSVAEESLIAKYALEPIINVLEGNGLESKSTDHLVEKHLYVPNEQLILIGSGSYISSTGDFFGGTDSGIMRPMLYGGVLFQLFYLMVIALTMRFFWGWRLLNLAILFLYFLLNVKAEIGTPSPHFALLSILYWLCRDEMSNENIQSNTIRTFGKT